MEKIIVAALLLLPYSLFAGTDCRVKEYQDHYDAECIGDEKAGTGSLQPGVTAQPGAQVDRQNDDIQVKRAAQPVSLGNLTTPSDTVVNDENIVSQNGVQNSQPAQQQPVLSKRNNAKLEIAKMKELRFKTQVEAGQ